MPNGRLGMCSERIPRITPTTVACATDVAHAAAGRLHTPAHQRRPALHRAQCPPVRAWSSAAAARARAPICTSRAQHGSAAAVPLQLLASAHALPGTPAHARRRPAWFMARRSMPITPALMPARTPCPHRACHCSVALTLHVPVAPACEAERTRRARPHQCRGPDICSAHAPEHTRAPLAAACIRTHMPCASRM